MKKPIPELPCNYNSIHYTVRKLVRLEYIRLQEGKCLHCGNDLTGFPTKEIMNKKLNLALFPPGFLTHRIHLHHNHETGMTIGAIHAECNGVLWQYHGE